MRKLITGGIAVTLGLSTALAAGAFAGGNGAQVSPLGPQSGSTTSQCVAGTAGGNGFVIVNAPGKPGAARFVNGEVSLKNGPANTTFKVELSNGDNNCQLAGALVTNGQGNGNAHLDSAGTSGSYYVVLQDASGNEVYASAPRDAN